MSNFKKDLSHEKILAEYLDRIYSHKNMDFLRVDDDSRQHQGIDLIFNIHSKEYFIDEKAQLHYLNADLPTFTFELSYLKDNDLKEGWLFDRQKLTHYYFLITGIFLKNGIEHLSHADDICKIRITSVNRFKLIDHLASIGLHREKLQEYDEHFRKSSAYGSNKISEFKNSSCGLIYFTEHLAEQPMNIQLRLEYLLENKIAKVFHTEC